MNIIFTRLFKIRKHWQLALHFRNYKKCWQAYRSESLQRIHTEIHQYSMNTYIQTPQFCSLFWVTSRWAVMSRNVEVVLVSFLVVQLEAAREHNLCTSCCRIKQNDFEWQTMASITEDCVATDIAWWQTTSNYMPNKYNNRLIAHNKRYTRPRKWF